MPIQYEFDFEVDINIPGELFLEMKLLDPCHVCRIQEADYTIPKTEKGICNSCANDEHMVWIERYVDGH